MAFPKLAGELIDVAIDQGGGGGGGTEAARHRTNIILLQIVVVVVVGGLAGGLRAWLFQSAAERVSKGSVGWRSGWEWWVLGILC